MYDLTNKVVTPMTIYVDEASHNVPSYVYAKQNDANSRYIVVKIMSASGQITLFGTARLNVITPGGSKLYGLGELNPDGTVTFELSQAMIASEGKVSCDITLYESEEVDDNNKILTTSTFFLIVAPSIYNDDAMESSGVEIPGDNYYTKGEVDAIIEELNYKTIVINSFSITNPNREVGSTVTSVHFSWSTSKTPVEIKILSGGNTIAEPAANATSYTLTGISITTNTTYTLSVKEAVSGDHQETVTTGTTGNASDVSLSFLYSRYWGVGATDPATDITLMSSELATNKGKTFSVNAGNGEYIWYIYTHDWGAATFKVGGFEGGFTMISSNRIIKNASGQPVTCYVYRSDNPGLGNTTVVVS